MHFRIPAPRSASNSPQFHGGRSHERCLHGPPAWGKQNAPLWRLPYQLAAGPPARAFFARHRDARKEPNIVATPSGGVSPGRCRGHGREAGKAWTDPLAIPRGGRETCVLREGESRPTRCIWLPVRAINPPVRAKVSGPPTPMVAIGKLNVLRTQVPVGSARMPASGGSSERLPWGCSVGPGRDRPAAFPGSIS